MQLPPFFKEYPEFAVGVLRGFFALERYGNGAFRKFRGTLRALGFRPFKFISVGKRHRDFYREVAHKGYFAGEGVFGRIPVCGLEFKSGLGDMSVPRIWGFAEAGRRTATLTPRAGTRTDSGSLILPIGFFVQNS